jgi:hypothetical protein
MEQVKEEAIRTYYELKVPAGSYTTNSLFSLLWIVFTHRLWHWWRGDGWVD